MDEYNVSELTKDELLKEYIKISEEYNALLESARAILHYEDFESAAKEIFAYCKKVTGATSGYVALLSDDGSENEVLFLDSGGLECTVDESLPMPIRGLRSEAYHLLKGVYDNNFSDSHWTRYLPKGHMVLDNVLFAPLIINEKVVGLIGLANKKDDFNDRDLSFISVLGDIAALSLRNSRNLELLKESEEKYRLITEYASDVIWIYNLEKKKFTFISPSIVILTGLTIDKAIKKSLEETFTKESLAKLTGIISKLYKRLKKESIDKINFITQVQQFHKNGDKIWIELSASIHYNSDNEVEIIGLSRNIEERKKIEEKLLYLSTHDQLTGIHNRHYFVSKLEKLEDSDVYPIAIISADLNGLKTVNDTFGHKMGDKYIKLCAKIFKESIRSKDILARVGGDEFAIILPNSARKTGDKIISSIKTNINNYNKTNEEKYQLGVSLGLAVCKSEKISLEETYNIADKRMYRDKRKYKKSILE